MQVSGTGQLPRTLAELEAGVRTGLHLGGQLYVSRGGQPQADLAFGEIRPGEPMRRDHLMLWLSSTKPVAAVAVARLWERGALDLDDRVADHLPEFGTRGKEAITVRHLLTHTAGIRMLSVGWPERSWEEILEGIYATRLEPRWVPGQRAGYHRASTWFVLGELVRRLEGSPFQEVARREIFEPLGMADCWVGMPSTRYRELRHRIAPLYDTAASPPAPSGWDDEAHVTRCHPGGNGYGPVRQLARLHECLLQRGRLGAFRLLTPQTVEAITARHRVGLLDRTFRTHLDWGLGVILNSNHHGAEPVPYAYGEHASLRTWGHSGYRSSTAFADPEHRLVVALAVNGAPDEDRHRERFHALLGSVYQDLGLEGARPAE